MIFDAAMFIAKAIAGSLAKEVGTDTYKTIKSNLVERFGLSSALSVIEEKPDGDSEVAFLASKIANTESIVDPEIIQLSRILAEEISQAEGASSPKSVFDISEIEAAELLVNQIKAKGSASFKAKNIRTSGRISIQNIELDGNK